MNDEDDLISSWVTIAASGRGSRPPTKRLSHSRRPPESLRAENRHPLLGQREITAHFLQISMFLRVTPNRLDFLLQ